MAEKSWTKWIGIALIGGAAIFGIYKFMSNIKLTVSQPVPDQKFVSAGSTLTLNCPVKNESKSEVDATVYVEIYQADSLGTVGDKIGSTLKVTRKFSANTTTNVSFTLGSEYTNNIEGPEADGIAMRTVSVGIQIGEGDYDMTPYDDVWGVRVSGENISFRIENPVVNPNRIHVGESTNISIKVINTGTVSQSVSLRSEVHEMGWSSGATPGSTVGQIHTSPVVAISAGGEHTFSYNWTCPVSADIEGKWIVVRLYKGNTQEYAPNTAPDNPKTFETTFDIIPEGEIVLNLQKISPVIYSNLKVGDYIKATITAKNNGTAVAAKFRVCFKASNTTVLGDEDGWTTVNFAANETKTFDVTCTEYIHNDWDPGTVFSGMVEIEGIDGFWDTNPNLVVASGTLQYYTLTLGADPSEAGTITLVPSQANYASGTTVLVTAHAIEGYVVDWWEVDGMWVETAPYNSPSDSINVYMGSNHNIIAHYKSFSNLQTLHVICLWPPNVMVYFNRPGGDDEGSVITPNDIMLPAGYHNWVAYYQSGYEMLSKQGQVYVSLGLNELIIPAF